MMGEIISVVIQWVVQIWLKRLLRLLAVPDGIQRTSSKFVDHTNADESVDIARLL